MGDRYLRRLLVIGATSVIRRARTSTSVSASWINALLERRPARIVTVAMANKTAHRLGDPGARRGLSPDRNGLNQDRRGQGGRSKL